MAGRLLEDLLCGALGYGIGSYREKSREFTQEQVESLIDSYLSQVPLEGVIDAWIKANDIKTYGDYVQVSKILKKKAEDIF